jgi:hypothetical protein
MDLTRRQVCRREVCLTDQESAHLDLSGRPRAGHMPLSRSWKLPWWRAEPAAESRSRAAQSSTDPPGRPPSTASASAIACCATDGTSTP